MPSTATTSSTNSRCTPARATPSSTRTLAVARATARRSPRRWSETGAVAIMRTSWPRSMRRWGVTRSSTRNGSGSSAGATADFSRAGPWGIRIASRPRARRRASVGRHDALHRALAPHVRQEHRDPAPDHSLRGRPALPHRAGGAALRRPEEAPARGTLRALPRREPRDVALRQAAPSSRAVPPHPRMVCRTPREDPAMRIIALEEHVVTPLYVAKSVRRPRPNSLADRNQILGHDISAELLDIGETRIRHMDAAGIDVQVLSLTMPGVQACDAP